MWINANDPALKGLERIRNFAYSKVDVRHFTSLIVAVIITALVTCYITSRHHSYVFSSTRKTQYVHVNNYIQQDVRTDSDDAVVQAFLASNPTNITSAPVPAYLPHLASQCFWEKQHLQFYKRRQAWPRPGYQLRCLPSVYLAGFSKSGTSDLFSQLSRHQHIFRSFYKEPHFWTMNKDTNKKKVMSMRDYTDMYSQATSVIESCCLSHAFVSDEHVHCAVNRKISASLTGRLNDRKRDHISKQRDKLVSSLKDNINMNHHQRFNSTHCPILTIDATPRYIWDGRHWKSDPNNRGLEEPATLLAEKLHHVQPDAKVIVIMRRPEDRLWSDYNYFKHSRKDPDDFHRKVVQGIDWWHRCTQLLSMENCAFGNQYEQLEQPKTAHAWENEGAERVRISIYYAFVKRWLEVFPRENLLFIRFEDYIRDPVNYLSHKVLPFLGLSDISDFNMDKIEENIESGPKMQNTEKHKTHMNGDTEVLLKSFYEPFNKKLADLLHEDGFLWKDL